MTVDIVDTRVIPDGLWDIDIAVVSVTDDYTITELDNIINVDASTSSITVTLPVTSTMPGLRQYYIKKVDSSVNTVIISGVQ